MNSKEKNKEGIVMIKLSPSILAADFTKLGEEIKILETEKVPYIHIDVMDGHFVQNISMGIPVLESIRKITNLVLDVHLMISNPEDYIERFAEAGADIINFHFEATDNPKKIIEQIRATGKKCGITINPETPVEKLFGIIEYVDMVLVMSVYPGLGGQNFMVSSLDRIRKIHNYIKNNNLNTDVEIDGGVDLENIREILAVGVNVIVAGSAVFQAKDIYSNIRKFNEIFKEFDYR